MTLCEFAEEFSLYITNTTNPDPSTNWTFGCSMGVRIRINFVLASKCLLVREAGPSDDSDLGSDHRAVQTTLSDIKQRTQVQSRKRAPTRGWCPENNVDGKALGYCELLDAPLQNNSVLRTEKIKKYSGSATGSSIPAQPTNRLKPWRLPEIQEIIQKRRTCNTSRERSDISK